MVPLIEALVVWDGATRQALGGWRAGRGVVEARGAVLRGGWLSPRHSLWCACHRLGASRQPGHAVSVTGLG